MMRFPGRSLIVLVLVAGLQMWAMAAPAMGGETKPDTRAADKPAAATPAQAAPSQVTPSQVTPPRETRLQPRSIFEEGPRPADDAKPRPAAPPEKPAGTPASPERKKASADRKDAAADAAADDTDTKVPLERLPAGVRRTLTREAGNAKIIGVWKMEEDGSTLYRARVRIDGDDYDIIVDAGGKLVSKALSRSARQVAAGPAAKEKLAEPKAAREPKPARAKDPKNGQHNNDHNDNHDDDHKNDHNDNHDDHHDHNN